MPFTDLFRARSTVRQASEVHEQGATDYVLKNDLGRLVLVVRRALRELGEQKAKAEVARELVRGQRLGGFFEEALKARLHWAGPDGIILKVNRAELELFGYSTAEYVGRHVAVFAGTPTPCTLCWARSPPVNWQSARYEAARALPRYGDQGPVLGETYAQLVRRALIRTRSLTSGHRSARACGNSAAPFFPARASVSVRSPPRSKGRPDHRRAADGFARVGTPARWIFILPGGKPLHPCWRRTWIRGPGRYVPASRRPSSAHRAKP